MPYGTCSICGAEGKLTRGWCIKHYKRWYKTGDPLGLRPNKPPASERFWARVSKTETCWIWTGATNNRGYGNFSPSSAKWTLAHRFSWELAHGPITDGLWVLHRCDNPPCVNPEHLFLGTRQENIDDMIGKRRHAHGQEHWRAFLSDAVVAEIRSRFTGSLGEVTALAQEYGVSKNMISRIRNGTRRSIPS